MILRRFRKLNWDILNKPWQPLTPGGAAAFAGASLTRLFVVQLLFAFGAAVSVLFFVSTNVSSVIGDFVRQIPEDAVMSRGEVIGLGSAKPAAGAAFLSLSLSSTTAVVPERPADLDVRLGATNVTACGILGCATLPYDPSWTFAMGRGHLEPKWGAWKPLIYIVVSLAVMAGLMVSWAALATVYFLPIRIAAFFTDRDLTIIGSWKMCGAAQMTGSLVQSVGIVLYALRLLDLPLLAGVMALHFLVSWVYVPWALLKRPKVEKAAKAAGNPFAG